MSELPDRRKPAYTHVCVDCGALAVAGGYHDHGDGNADDTIPLSLLPTVIRSFQRIEVERDELEAEARLLREICRTNGWPDLAASDESERA